MTLSTSSVVHRELLVRSAGDDDDDKTDTDAGKRQGDEVTEDDGWMDGCREAGSSCSLDLAFMH